MKTVYLGLDVSSSNIGWCIYDINRKIYVSGVEKNKSGSKKKRIDVARFVNLSMKNIIQNEHIKGAESINAVIELPIGKFKTQQAGDMVHFSIGCAAMFMDSYEQFNKENCVCVRFISQLDWKKFFTENAMSDKFGIQLQVEDLIGRFIEDDNEADAVGICYTGLMLDKCGIDKFWRM